MPGYKDPPKEHQFSSTNQPPNAGRPPGIPNAKTRYKRLLELTSKKANPVTGELEEFTQMELMDMAVFNKALKGDMIAYKEIMNRLEGLPQQSVDLTSQGKSIVEHPLAGEEVAYVPEDDSDSTDIPAPEAT